MQRTKEDKNIVQSLISLLYDEDTLSKYINSRRSHVRLFDSNKIDADFHRKIPTPDGRFITQIVVDFKQVELELFYLNCYGIDKGFNWIITIMDKKEMSFIRDCFYETLERECGKIKVADCTGNQLYNGIKDRIDKYNDGRLFQEMLGFDHPSAVEWPDNFRGGCLFPTESSDDGYELSTGWVGIYIAATELLKSYVAEKV